MTVANSSTTLYKELDRQTTQIVAVVVAMIPRLPIEYVLVQEGLGTMNTDGAVTVGEWHDLV